jgi:uncharacterized membrane protein YphA (DoxX/SURF4 family)
MKALFLSFAVGLFVGVLFGVIRGKLCARALEVVAGLSLAFGIYPRLAAVALVVFLVPSTVIGHAFWQVDGTASFTIQLINFLKNTAIVGGLLFIGATQSQPTLLPHTSRSDAREQRGSERDSRSPAAVA